jgi:2-hydroxychromene-2-carboxylate isomerase
MIKRQVLHMTDYKSSYSYLAKDPAYALGDEFDVAVECRHFTLDIPSFLGAVEPRNETEWRKMRYAYMDMRRWANKRGLTVKGPRRIYDSSPAAIGMQYAQDQNVFRPYNDRVFDRFWNHQIEVDDVAAITAVLDEVDADTAGFAHYLAGEGRLRHDAMRLETEKLGVFGVPSFVLDGEIFWGYDRMGLLRERLSEV